MTTQADLEAAQRKRKEILAQAKKAKCAPVQSVVNELTRLDKLIKEAKP